MKIALAGLLFSGCLLADPRIDNVLVKMVPPGSTGLVGVRMDEVRNTAFYREMMQQNKLPQLEQFVQQTGFDPRRDVRELLFISTASGGVLVARGSFRLRPDAMKDGKLVRHGVYNVWSFGNAGFCILDGTLAAAGDLPSVMAALDEWTAGRHAEAQPLLSHARQIEAAYPLWGVSTGIAGFIADNMPKASGVDFSKIFHGLSDTWFEAGFTAGLKAAIHGVAATEQDAVSLRDTAKGLIGFGRLSVPENEPEMLRLWDGIKVEQESRSIEIRMDISQDLVDRMVRMMGALPSGRGRGRGRGRQ